MRLTDLLEERRKRKAEESLHEFFLQAWHVLEPNTPLVDSWHYELICQYLELITRGEFRKRYPDKLGLIINVPPRTGKSTLVSVSWPCWSWIDRPGMRFLCASYSDQLASEHSLNRRNLITSRWYQSRWGDRFMLSADRNRINDFGNDKMGVMTGTSVGGTMTGLGGDVVVGDDLLCQDDAFSDAAKAATNRWIDGTMSTKLNSPASGAFVHISQRLAEDDPSGHLLEQAKEKWIHIKVPLVCTEDEEVYEFPGRGK
jgi:hypothetical protein